MILNILMSITLWPTALIVFLVVYKCAMSTKKTFFGATLSPEKIKSEEAREIVKSFKKENRIFILSTFWIPVIAYFTDYVSIQFTIWISWFMVEVLVLMFIPQIRANKKAMMLKDPIPVNESTVSYFELRTVRCLRIRELVIPMVLSLLPGILLLCFGKSGHIFGGASEELSEYFRAQYEGDGIILLILGVCTLLFAAVAIYMDRGRTLVINGESDINTSYSRAKKMVWKRFWMWLIRIHTGLCVLFAAASYFDFCRMPVLIVSTIIEGFLAIFFTVRLFKETRSIDDAYFESFELPDTADDDRYWKWGMFYCNRNDRRTFVDKRFGVGLTTNMASKYGIATIVIGIATLIWIPFVCIYMIKSDFTPMKLCYTENCVVCTHLSEEYRIPKDEIIFAELVESLPKRTKRAGSESDMTEMGEFRNTEIGVFNEFVTLENKTIIYIKTEDETYFINDATKEETMKVYEIIKTN